MADLEPIAYAEAGDATGYSESPGEIGCTVVRESTVFAAEPRVTPSSAAQVVIASGVKLAQIA